MQADLHLLPRPASVNLVARCSGFSLHRALALGAGADAGARELLDERWRALGIPLPVPALRGDAPDVTVTLGGGSAQSYHLSVAQNGIAVRAADADGAFYAFATLAQLARKSGADYAIPCVDIADAPALAWRVLSDDVSRGPLPTMRYFQERIRTIAAFKMNGYSPYMEHVFADPRHPLPAPLDGITPKELSALDAYARRFHVAFIPEQQTYAHMHNTLRWERYAQLAELPHGALLTPVEPGSQTYVQNLIADELAAAPHPPFFHIGSDEPFELGRGRSKALLDREGEGVVYTSHVVDTANFVLATSKARPMLWDDALARHPEMFSELPRSLVFVNWHYGNEKTFMPYIERIAKAGFEQMVAPGALNWNEIYPDCDNALSNIGRFTSEGKAARVLGLFQTVWHDDGETLFEASWYPVIYAAASAWEQGSVDRARYERSFPFAFFGVDDPRYGYDVANSLAGARTLLAAAGDPIFWADPFDRAFWEHLNARANLSAIRLNAEQAMEHLRIAPPPPLHRNAAAVMFLAARRYDALARNAQIAKEARERYENALAHPHKDDIVYADLLAAKYLLWEQRDIFLELEPLVRAAWEYENRPSHELSVLERYHLAAQQAIARADAIRRATYEGYQQNGALPPFNALIKPAGMP